MKVGDLVIVANKGEMRVYKANPRDLEAEAGLKPEDIKLDLINSFDYIEGHQKIKDIVSDEAGRFKADSGKMGASNGEDHNLENKLEEDVIKQIAQDIDKIVQEHNPPRYFLALPERIYKRVLENVQETSKLFKLLKEDIVKKDKQELIDFFAKKGELYNL